MYLGVYLNLPPKLSTIAQSQYWSGAYHRQINTATSPSFLFPSPTTFPMTIYTPNVQPANLASFSSLILNNMQFYINGEYL